MAQSFSDFLASIANAKTLANMLVKVRVAKKAAQILKSKIKFKTQGNVVILLPSLMTNPAFLKYINTYKNSSYYGSSTNDMAFANLVMKYL